MKEGGGNKDAKIKCYRKMIHRGSQIATLIQTSNTFFNICTISFCKFCSVSQQRFFAQKNITKYLPKLVWVSSLFWLNNLGLCKAKKLETQQKKAIRHIAHRGYNSHTAEIFKELEYLKVNDLISQNQAIFARNYKNHKLPGSFTNLLCPLPDQGVRRVRDDDYNFLQIPLLYVNLHYFPVPRIISNWNSLPLEIKSVSDLSEFRRDLKSHFLSKYVTVCDVINCFSCNN